jgi:signal transduction histidine kinase
MIVTFLADVYNGAKACLLPAENPGGKIVYVLCAVTDIINSDGRSVIILVLLMILLVIVLFFSLRKIKYLNNELCKSNIRMDELNEEISKANSIIKSQHDELISIREKLNTSEYRYEMLFDKMMNAFFILEPIFNRENILKDFRFVKANPAFFSHANIPEEDITGKTWQDVMGYPNQEMGYFRNLLNKGRAERFESYHSKSGSYYLVDAFLISDNQVGVILENITEYKKAIKEIKDLNAELEKRVAERTAKLQEAVNELESFSYTVSHDLKTPLRAVDGYVRILLEDFGDQLDNDAVQMLNNISTISREAIDMTNKLLQYAKTSRAELNRENIDIDKKFADVYNELRLAYPNRNINMIIETRLPVVYVDRLLFRLLVQNILSNAFKFTKGREKAVIRVGCTLTADEYIFYVRDNGVGFNMKYSGKLFGIFQRLHTADEFEGSGIGLVTVKKIIEKHGGRVWIEGKIDEGAVVYFSVPYEGM